jgi:hypothetical protein
MEDRHEFDFAADETPVTDEELVELVGDTLENDERVDATYIEVSAENGIVFLEGTVATGEEVEMAESLLDDIEGIQAVQNNLLVVESGYTPDETLAGTGEEDEFEGVEPLPDDEKLTSEDPMEAVEEGKSYVPPNEPTFPTERAHAAERMRRRRADEESAGKTTEEY